MDQSEMLDEALAKARELLRKKAEARSLPEEETLLNKEHPSGGVHAHDESNPLGVHRHHPGNELDGGHVHTPQNPGGEHVHGELAGQALVDGAHYHKNGGLGWHNHHEEDLGKNLNVINPETGDSYQSGDAE